MSVDVVHVVTYKVSKDTAKAEKVCFTKEAAEQFAATIEELGGVSVITEDTREVPATEDLSTPTRSLQW